MNFNKESKGYLGQIRNNVLEKVQLIEQAVDDKNLPKNKEGVVVVVELGTGGGESLKHLREHINDFKDIKLVAVDLLPSLVMTAKKEIGIGGIAADAGNLPFKEKTVSAINASAVLHEISSYGTDGDNGGKLYGKDAIVKSFEEFNRVLMLGGKLLYRDVLAPLENLRGQKQVKYSQESWKLFAEWFIKNFIDSNPRFYKETDIELSREKSFEIIAPVGFQRDFQRHYLMLRDYLRNVKQKEFGITIISSSWLKETEGLKNITFSINESLSPKIDLSGFETTDTRGVYRGNSDQFDKLYDDLMEYFFSEMNKGTDEGEKFRNMIQEWREREGLEHYIYGNISDLLKLSCEASMKTANPFVLFPESISDLMIAPRFYYNRYLRQVSDHPEEDGKQIIAFKKMSRVDAVRFLQSLESSGGRGNKFLDKQHINELKSLLE
jgi:ubiquinone/menaquinone biosynthesis C-methylase UbiE